MTQKGIEDALQRFDPCNILTRQAMGFDAHCIKDRKEVYSYRCVVPMHVQADSHSSADTVSDRATTLISAPKTLLIARVKRDFMASKPLESYNRSFRL